MQYVKVDLDGKAYTYGWTGSEPLKRGDRVVVPGNVVNPEQSVRTVLRAMPGPDYDVDKIVNILDRVHLQPSQQSRPGPVDPVLYDGDGNMSFPPTSHLTQLDEKMASIFTDEAQNEAMASRYTDRPEPHDWDDLIGDPYGEDWGDYGYPNAHEEGDRS